MEGPSWIDILLLPVLLSLFSGIILMLAIKASEETGKATRGWYIGLAVGAIALIVGLQQTWLMVNPHDGAFYRASLYGRGKTVYYSHFLAPIIPLLVIATAFAVKIVRDRRAHEGF